MEEVRELSIEVEGVEDAPKWKGVMLGGEPGGFFAYAEKAKPVGPMGVSPPPFTSF